MIIFNTTYHVEQACVEEFIRFLRTEFVPAATADGAMCSPRLTAVMVDNPEAGAEGQSLALQFEIADLDRLNTWYAATGAALNEKLVGRFGQRVMGFSTLMKALEL